MDLETTDLWRAAFVTARSDATLAEQQYFQELLRSLRTKAALLVSRITADMPDMTVHDISHLDALWNMASIVAKGAFDLNPPEAFVFGGAVLLHDAGMTLAAYPGGLDSLRNDVVWKDSYARHFLRASDAGNGNTNVKEIEELATAEALRRLHALQAEKLPMLQWTGANGLSETLIDDPTVRNFYGPKIGQVAHSHWWDIGKIEDELSVDLGPLGGKTGNKIDVLKIACLLRVADAMHLNRQRAPSFMSKLLNPKGISAAHWAFQERMATPYVEKDALVYSAAPPFDLGNAEAWWLAYDAIVAVDKELRDVDNLMRQRGTSRLIVNHVKGVSSPKELSQYVETLGWVPVNSAVRVSDVPKIVETLGGSKLYGNDPAAPLRELIQNAADAIDARRKLQNRPASWGEISISIQNRDDEHWLVIEDTGIGMSERVMTGPLIDFGNSFWRSAFASEEFPGIQAAGISATGKYGIGFFSVFMLGRRVRVISRRYDNASDSVRTLEFLNGLNSRPILYIPSAAESPVDGGTRVEVLLDKSPKEAGGLLAITSNIVIALSRRIAALAPSMAVKISVDDGSGFDTAIEANDWRTLAEKVFLARLARADREGKGAGTSKERLRPLTDSFGTEFGRAMIETNRYVNSDTGCITVGGLRSSKVDLIRGVLLGRESTASRNEAYPLAPPSVLAAWATEQAALVSAASLTGEDKARGAQVVLQFGGDIGDLPIVRVAGEWLNSNELRSKIASSDVIHVFNGGTVDYNEDYDNVLPRDFAQALELSDSIYFVPKDLPGYVWSTPKFLEQLGEDRKPKLLYEIVESITFETFGVDVEEEDEEKVVGRVYGEDIERTVTSYRRQITDDEMA